MIFSRRESTLNYLYRGLRSEKHFQSGFFKNAKKCSLWKPEACGQTVLRDRSFLIGQKLAENAKNLLMNTGSPTEPVVIKSVGL